MNERRQKLSVNHAMNEQQGQERRLGQIDWQTHSGYIPM